ncbi:hypothetical protein Hdeb2414_s0001g00029241 [Helianthus debilis subsp. tardiflorus]
MRCKQHYTDHSSIVGVCASCLRERLFYLVAAQEHTQLHPQTQSQTLEERNRNLETHPVFPRSVSPYITRRKSDTASSTSNQRKGDTNRHRNVPEQRFFSTPQVGGYNSNNSNNIYNNQKKKHSFIRFNLLSKLFRSRKQKDPESDSDPRFSVSDSRGSCGGGGGGGGDSTTSAMSSPFRFSNIRTGSRKKQPVCVSECSTRAGTVMRKQYCSDRGMSPVRLSDCGGVEDEFYDGSSGYETCESRKQTPWRTPAHPTVRRGGIGSFCLSPLVRASPCQLWSLPAADGGDTRAPVKPHLSNTKSFCANRSRKLADFGRFNSNR